MFTRGRLPLRLGVLAGLVFVASFAASVATAQVTQPRSQAPRTRLIGEPRLGTWGYLATEQEGTVVLNLSLARKDTAGLTDFVRANDALAPGLFAQQPSIEGRVVFRRPLAETALPASVRAGLDAVKGYELRRVGANGVKFTAFGAPRAGRFLPPDMLSVVQGALARAGGGRADFKGLVSVTLQLNAARYTALRGLPEVLVVDVTPAAATAHFKQAFATQAAGKPVAVSYASTYWYYEQAGNPPIP